MSSPCLHPLPACSTGGRRRSSIPGLAMASCGCSTWPTDQSSLAQSSQDSVVRDIQNYKGETIEIIHGTVLYQSLTGILELKNIICSEPALC